MVGGGTEERRRVEEGRKEGRKKEGGGKEAGRKERRTEEEVNEMRRQINIASEKRQRMLSILTQTRSFQVHRWCCNST